MLDGRRRESPELREVCPKGVAPLDDYVLLCADVMSIVECSAFVQSPALQWRELSRVCPQDSRKRFPLEQFPRAQNRCGLGTQVARVKKGVCVHSTKIRSSGIRGRCSVLLPGGLYQEHSRGENLMRAPLAPKVLGIIFVLLLAAGTFCSPAYADTVTIGTNTNANVFPFSSGYLGEYQQIYSASMFSGPVYITGITFFPTASVLISGQFTIHLSTTSAGVTTISSTYANNIGADNTQFFSGTVSNVNSFAGGPFLYDPSLGNLLMDVNTISASGIPSFSAGCSPDTNRVFNLGGTGAPTIGFFTLCGAGGPYGLLTQFTVAPVNSAVPEPATLLLVGSGIASIYLKRKRRAS